MSREQRQLLGDLLAARGDGSPERVAECLRDDARYWDTERGEVRGREAVAQALAGSGARLEIETMAVSGDDAVVEVQVLQPGGSYRSTEVYRLAGDGIASVRAYFDPLERAG